MTTWEERKPTMCKHILNVILCSDTIRSERNVFNRMHVHVSLYFYEKVQYFYRTKDYVYVVFSGCCGSILRYKNPYKDYLTDLKIAMKKLESETREIHELTRDEVDIYRNARTSHIRNVIRNLRSFLLP